MLGRNKGILYCIVLYCIVLYCIVLYCIVLCCIVLYCIVYNYTSNTLLQYLTSRLFYTSYWNYVDYIHHLFVFCDNIHYSDTLYHNNLYYVNVEVNMNCVK